VTCRHEAHCWACGFNVTTARGRVGQRVAVEAYELAVELIEGWPGPFTRTEVGRRLWERLLWEFKGEVLPRALYPGSAYTYAGHAVNDLASHGLVRCVRRAGKRCLAWEVVA
jgi:hypothetical protein